VRPRDRGAPSAPSTRPEGHDATPGALAGAPAEEEEADVTPASDVRDVRRLAPVVLPERLWRERERRHHDAVDSLTRDHLHRRQRGTPHPVVDFLFTYYRTSVGTIRRWHPGPGVLLENAHHDPRAQWRHYRRATLHGRTGLIVDPDSVLARGGTRLRR